ncbi:MAG: phage baseplate assembly protein [Clostridia bacterium]|nr:phage baseplate assembly protein [Clostridia bacterium]
MWIPEKIAETSRAGDVFTANVTGTDGSLIRFGGDVRASEAEAFFPYGVASVPPEGVRAAVVRAGRTLVVPCCECTADISLEAGEVALYSSGGASIILKNDGSVVINGRVFGTGE